MARGSSKQSPNRLTAKNTLPAGGFFRNLATMRILGLFVDAAGTLLYDTATIRPAVGLLSFFETRDHVEESEWRIAGETGFMGGRRASSTRIPLRLSDVEYLFAPNVEGVQRLTEKVEELAKVQGAVGLPKIVEFPSVVPE